MRLFAKSSAYDPLPGYERSNGNTNGNPPPYKNGRYQAMSQRYRILRSPTRIFLAIVIIAGIIGLIGNGGYHKRGYEEENDFQEESDRHRLPQGGPPPLVHPNHNWQQSPEEDAWERDALEELWQPFPRYTWPAGYREVSLTQLDTD